MGGRLRARLINYGEIEMRKQFNYGMPATAERRVTLDNPNSCVVKSIAFSPDGDMIVSGGWDIIDRPRTLWVDDYTSPGTIQVWDCCHR